VVAITGSDVSRLFSYLFHAFRRADVDRALRSGSSLWPFSQPRLFMSTFAHPYVDDRACYNVSSPTARLSPIDDAARSYGIYSFFPLSGMTFHLPRRGPLFSRLVALLMRETFCSSGIERSRFLSNERQLAPSWQWVCFSFSLSLAHLEPGPESVAHLDFLSSLAGFCSKGIDSVIPGSA